MTLVATADRVRDGLSQVVEPHGITLQQYNVLRILRGAGASGLPTLEIAARMVEKSPGITRLIDRLGGAALVRRVALPQRPPPGAVPLDGGGQPAAGCARRADGRRPPPARFASLDRARTLVLIDLLDAIRPPKAHAPTEPSTAARTRRES